MLHSSTQGELERGSLQGHFVTPVGLPPHAGRHTHGLGTESDRVLEGKAVDDHSVLAGGSGAETW